MLVVAGCLACVSAHNLPQSHGTPSVSIAVFVPIGPTCTRQRTPQARHRNRPHLVSMVLLKAAKPMGFDGKVVCDFALKVPATKRTGEASRDQAAKLDRECMIRVIDQCLKDRRFIMPLHAFLMTCDPAANTETNASWTGDYRSLERIPKGWVADFILNLAKGLGVAIATRELLNKVEADDSANLGLLFMYLVQLPGAFVLPGAFSSSTVASMVLRERAKEVGDRLKLFVQNQGISPSGALQWGKGGCYKLRFDAAGKCDLITHVATDESIEPPSHVLVTSAYSLQDNHLDHKAAVFLSPVRHQLSEFFPQTARVRTTMYCAGKKFQSIARLTDRVVTDLQTAEEERKKATIEGGDHILQEAVQTKAAASVEKARVAMSLKRKERVDKRTLKLST